MFKRFRVSLFAAKVMLSVVVSLCCLWAVQAEAVPIPGLYDTGVDSSNALLPDGAIDPHYTLTLSSDPLHSGPAAFVVNSSSGDPIFTGPWLADGPNSKWIAPQANQSFATGGDPAGLYTYQTTFDLTGLNPATAVIMGEWTADNEGVNILINGISTGITTPTDAFTGFTPFTISSGFQNGINTLDFEVENDGNATGLRVELSGTASPVSEPVSLLLFGAGLMGMAVIGRKNRKGEV